MCLRDIRSAFLAEDALAVVISLVMQPLARFPKMAEKDSLMVQLVLTFIRQVTAVSSTCLASRLAGQVASGRA